MRRRAFVGAGLSLAGAALLPAQTARSGAGAFSRVRPGQPGWPVTADWTMLGAAVGGRLAPVTMPDLTGPDAKALLGNPFYLADQPGLSQSSGWLDAWRSSPSAYVLRVAAPDTGAYVNECDYFQDNWQSAFWARTIRVSPASSVAMTRTACSPSTTASAARPGARTVFCGMLSEDRGCASHARAFDDERVLRGAI